MSLLRVNGANLNVQVTGSGPTVVALHGFTGDMSTWASFVDSAAGRHQVVAIDLLGHGHSDSPPGQARYSIENVVRDVAAVLERLNITSAAWMGYSMGGRIALMAGAMIPERCTCLVLEGASPGIENPVERAARLKSDEELALFIEQNGLEAFVDRWERHPLFASQVNLPAEVRAWLRTRRLSNNPHGLASTLRAAGPAAQAALHGRLPTILMPVICVVGERDGKFRAIADNMCRGLPVGRVAVIPGAGHCAHMEQPEQFNGAVLDFLNGAGAREVVAERQNGTRTRHSSIAPGQYES